MSLFVIHSRRKPSTSIQTDAYVELESKTSTSAVDLSFSNSHRPLPVLYRSKRYSLSSSALSSFRGVDAKKSKASSSITTPIMEEDLSRGRDRHALPPSVVAKRRLTLQTEDSAGNQKGNWDDILSPRAADDASPTKATPPIMVPAKCAVDADLLGPLSQSSESKHHPWDFAARPENQDTFLSDCIHEELREVEPSPDPNTTEQRPQPSAVHGGELFGEKYQLHGTENHAFDIEGKRKASHRLSESVQGFGRKMKRRLSSAFWRKDSIAYQPAPTRDPHQNIFAIPTQSGLDIEAQTYNHRQTSNRLWPLPQTDDQLDTHTSAPTYYCPPPAVADDSETSSLDEAAEPLLGPKPIPLGICSGYGQAIANPRRRTLMALPPASSATLSPPPTTLAAERHSPPSFTEVNAPNLARLSIAVSKADEEGQFSPQAIAARFDSAVGSRTDLPEQVLAAGQWRAEAAAKAAADRGRTLERKKEGAGEPVRPIFERARSSLFGSVGSRTPTTGAGVPPRSRERQRFSVQAVAGVSDVAWRRGSGMML